MSVKTAIIGLGIMGRRMAEHMALHPGYTVTALWDPDPKACEFAKSIVPEATITSTAEQALTLADLVYLACPPVPPRAHGLAYGGARHRQM